MKVSAEKIKQLRKQQSWSQELLAKVSGLSLRTIQRVEKDSNASSETLLALAAAFNVSPSQLCNLSVELNAHWKWRNIMQNSLALTVMMCAVVFLLFLAAPLYIYIDKVSILFTPLFMYACTVMAFGSSGLIKSLSGLKHLFSQQVEYSSASVQLSSIYDKQIQFIYGGAFIAVLIGTVAIHGNIDLQDDLKFHHGYAVNILVFFYAAVFAEGILRPLKTKLVANQGLSSS